MSYANREPKAWSDLFDALQGAGFRAIGYAIVHGENETDHAKLGLRACNLDLIMDLVPAAESEVIQSRPGMETLSDEEKFLNRIGEAFLKLGNLEAGWGESFMKELVVSPFLSEPKK